MLILKKLHPNNDAETHHSEDIACDDLDDCYLDVDGDLYTDGPNKAFAKPGMTYKFSVKKITENGKTKRVLANIQLGDWSVIMNQNQPPINNDNSFQVPVDESGKNILIKY